ncbi:MAG: hypothetical protein A2Y17_02620 [Clostridiales bacterium GWF2_38_85]|nr:MAG: hypothetical protein A2Y17_02620 [Clostridiales bacterium GWF2_38_85]
MKRKLITIARQFCSGGDDIAQKLAEALNIDFFDKGKIKERIKEHGIDEESFERLDKRTASSFLYSLAVTSMHGHIPASINDVVIGDHFFETQSELINKIASETDAIFLGRCADYILDSKYELVKIFIYADFEDRVEAAEKEFNIKDTHARTLVKKSDKKRASYYNFYTGKVWGNADNYDISINAGTLGIDSTVKLLKTFIEIAISKHKQ